MYPGATQTAYVAAPANASGELRFNAAFAAPDPLDKVVAFYEGNLQAKAVTGKGDRHLFTKTRHGADVGLFFSAGGPGTVVRVQGIIYPKS